MQQVYQDAAAHGSEGVLVERLKVQFENSIIKQLSLKVSSLNVKFLGGLGKDSFQTASIKSNSNISQLFFSISSLQDDAIIISLCLVMTLCLNSNS